MSPRDLADEHAAFAALIEEHLGFDRRHPRGHDIEALWRERMHATGSRDVDAYRRRLVSPSSRRAELQALAERLTVGETYFFREPRDFETFIRIAVPQRLAHAPEGRALRVLSVGCASGEEAYSTAITLQESARSIGVSAEVHGIDVNARAIEQARRACYSKWSLRSTPDDLRARYFRASDQGYELDGAIRGAVTFEERNLLDEDPAFWQPGSFDVVFCRNVLIYFSPRMLAVAVDRLAAALAPGGFLFLGYSESLHGVSDAFEVRRAHGGFHYLRRPSRAAPAVPAPPPAPEAPRGAAEAGGRVVQADIDLAKALFRAERFQEALAVLERGRVGGTLHPETELLRAAILTNQGSLAAAEAACRRVLSVAPRNPSARYLLALCRAQGGDVREAIEHHRAAIRIDPGFAMAHLQLGMLARRRGERAAAREALRAAMERLASEDDPTLALLSGGFGRSALIEMCRAELAACEEAP